MPLIISNGRIVAASSYGGGGRDVSPRNPETFRDGDARWISYSAPSKRHPNISDWGCDSWSIWQLICTQAAVGEVLDGFSQRIGMLGSSFYERDADDCLIELPSTDELQEFNREPSPGMTRQEWSALMIYDYQAFANCFALKWRAFEGDRLWLLPLPAELVSPGEDAGLFVPSFYWLGRGENRVRIEATDMVHIPRTPSRGGWGVTPLISLKDALAEQAASTKYRRAMFENGVQVGGFIEVDQHYEGSYKKLQRLREQIQNRHGGATSAGSVAVLEKGMSFKAASIDPQSLEYLQVRKVTAAEVRSRYGIPDTSSAGSGDGSNKASKTVDADYMTTEVLAPIVEYFDAALTMKLKECFPGRQFERITSWQAKLRPDIEKESRAYLTAAGGPWMTRNEIRAEKNLKPVEGGDKLLEPLNHGFAGEPRQEERPQQVRAERVLMELKEAHPEAFLVKAISRGDEADKHAELLRKTFERQRKVVVKELEKGGTTVADLFDRARWDRELSDDLAKLNNQTMGKFWARWADELDLDADSPDWKEAARLEADAAAEAINDSTEQRLGKALGAGDETEVKEAANNAFTDDRRTKRSAERTISVIAGFTGEAAGRAGGFTHKRWVDTDGKSDRHPPTPDRVRLGERFSNGGLYPGDGEDAFGCDCILSIEK